jgi:hypothetical protein
LLISIAAHQALAQAVPHSYLDAEPLPSLDDAHAILFRRIFRARIFRHIFLAALLSP